MKSSGSQDKLLLLYTDIFLKFVWGIVRWMNGHYLRAFPADELVKVVGERWKSSGILNESEGKFVEVSLTYLGKREEGESDLICLHVV